MKVISTLPTYYNYIAALDNVLLRFVSTKEAAQDKNSFTLREIDIIGVDMSSAYKVTLMLCPNLKCGFLNANAINSQYYF